MPSGSYHSLPYFVLHKLTKPTHFLSCFSPHVYYFSVSKVSVLSLLLLIPFFLFLPTHYKKRVLDLLRLSKLHRKKLSIVCDNGNMLESIKEKQIFKMAKIIVYQNYPKHYRFHIHKNKATHSTGM